MKALGSTTVAVAPAAVVVEFKLAVALVTVKANCAAVRTAPVRGGVPKPSYLVPEVIVGVGLGDGVDVFRFGAELLPPPPPPLQPANRTGASKADVNKCAFINPPQ